MFNVDAACPLQSCVETHYKVVMSKTRNKADHNMMSSTSGGTLFFKFQQHHRWSQHPTGML